jgi:hypothetical protein
VASRTDFAYLVAVAALGVVCTSGGDRRPGPVPPGSGDDAGAAAADSGPGMQAPADTAALRDTAAVTPDTRTTDTAAAMGASSLVKDGDAVFFVGNSFFGWEDRPLAEWVAALGRAVAPPVRLETAGDIVFGNMPLGDFLQHQATRAALASRKYKVYVLQGEEFEPVDGKPAFHQAVRDFNKAIVAAGGRTVLFMTWEFQFRPFLTELAASYDQIGAELGIPVVPVGLIYKDCDRTPYLGASPYWLTGGDLHQNEKGSAVNTYATFSLLTGRDPGGANFTAPGNTNGDAIMKYFSRMAWARVVQRLTAIKP